MSELSDRGHAGAATAEGCPSSDALSAFTSGRLAEAELVTIADHVSRCDTCESAVRGLSGADGSLATRLRAAVLEPVLGEEPSCLRMQEAAIAIPGRRDESLTVDTEPDASTGASCIVNERPDVATAFWAPAIPPKIGRYRVHSELGQGGFGSVYLASDPDLDRLVAIKFPRFNAAVTDQQIECFLQEARTAAKLKHPGIVTIYEVGRQEDGSSYIVMEHVEGQSLAAEMGKGRLPVARAVQIVAQTAVAAQYAHKQGLIHRDLKPGNILLDNNGQVKVADFGLALHEDQQRSRAGELAGTPAFMSPEQVRRDVHRLDGRSDIWALGVILYELLTGKRPFSGTREQIADEILNRHPKPPRQISDDIDPALEAICLKCLAKDPQQRYTSCQDLAADLTRWQQPVAKPAPRRYGWRVALWSALALALAGCAAAVAVLPRLLKEQEQPYLVDFVAKPYVPLDLMARPPELIFPKDSPSQWWDHQRRPPEVKMASGGDLFLGLGLTQSKDYRLRVEACKAAAAGKSSLFFGFHEGPRENGLRRWYCQALTIARTPGWPPYVSRERLTIIESWAGSLSLIQDDFIGEVKVEDLPIDAVLMELEVRGGKVVNVRVAGRLYPELADPIQGQVDDPTQGRFGLFNYKGNTTFREARFESLKVQPPK